MSLAVGVHFCGVVGLNPLRTEVCFVYRKHEIEMAQNFQKTWKHHYEHVDSRCLRSLDKLSDA